MQATLRELIAPVLFRVATRLLEALPESMRAATPAPTIHVSPGGDLCAVHFDGGWGRHILEVTLRADGAPHIRVRVSMPDKLEVFHLGWEDRGDQFARHVIDYVERQVERRRAGAAHYRAQLASRGGPQEGSTGSGGWAGPGYSERYGDD